MASVSQRRDTGFFELLGVSFLGFKLTTISTAAADELNKCTFEKRISRII
jgi:hypothetical protein